MSRATLKKDSKVNSSTAVLFQAKRGPQKENPQRQGTHTQKDAASLRISLIFCEAGGFFQFLSLLVAPLNFDGEMFAFASLAHTSSAAN